MLGKTKLVSDWCPYKKRIWDTETDMHRGKIM